MRSLKIFIAAGLTIPLLFFSGCTHFHHEEPFYRMRQTLIKVDSENVSQVVVNGQEKQISDQNIFPIHYEQKIAKQVRKVTYWKTKPGITLLFVVLSFGFYIPFSLIPVDPETKTSELDEFRNNEFEIRLGDTAGNSWETTLVLKNEAEIVLKPDFKKGGIA